MGGVLVEGVTVGVASVAKAGSANLMLLGVAEGGGGAEGGIEGTDVTFARGVSDCAILSAA